MLLSKNTLANVAFAAVKKPSENSYLLPEKILQFGTGVLLRGLPDYFINKANNQGIFNGRIVVVKSTLNGSTAEFDDQDCLFTHCIRGIEDGNKVEENVINSAISRVLSATDQWNEILECAENAAMEIVISNTTEVGIYLDRQDKIDAAPPVSFPAKLLSFLYKRFLFFNADADKGMVIIPTELIPENGKKLKAILSELAKLNGLEPSFITWLQTSNYFCDSLVDRIVPGKLPDNEKEKLEKETGYTDNLMIMSEPYALWAIETKNLEVAKKLSFGKANRGVVIERDISKFRELKLRLLNGTHTFSCGLAWLAGFKTVKQAMDDEEMAGYIQQLMQKEIAPNIPYDIDIKDAIAFSESVLDRFRNPYINHNWLAITVQYSSKMKLRNLPVLFEYYKRTKTVPPLMALGFAAHILFMKCKNDNGYFYGNVNETKYGVQDDNAGIYARKWLEDNGSLTAKSVLSDQSLWQTDLTGLPGFADAVTAKLNALLAGEVKNLIKGSLSY